MDWPMPYTPIADAAAAANSVLSLKGCLVVAGVLFAIGAWGAIARRNLLIVLISIELMLNAVNLVFASFARMHASASAQPAGENGQIFALFIIAVAAAEAAVGLAIVITYFRNKETVDTRDMTELKH
jgi:NADH-quinone oxidoreductase subunit K